MCCVLQHHRAGLRHRLPRGAPAPAEDRAYPHQQGSGVLDRSVAMLQVRLLISACIPSAGHSSSFGVRVWIVLTLTQYHFKIKKKSLLNYVCMFLFKSTVDCYISENKRIFFLQVVRKGLFYIPFLPKMHRKKHNGFFSN